MPRRRPFKQTEMADLLRARESEGLEPARRGAITRARNREAAAWNAVLTNTTSFFDVVQPTAARIGVWSEMWFPVPGDPAAPERARMSARSMRERVGRGQASIRDYRFLTETADWLDAYAGVLENARSGRSSVAQVDESFAAMRARWDWATSARRQPAAHRSLF